MNLSEKQISRIQYECMILRRSPQELQVIAPWLFIEGVTAANTEVIEEIVPTGIKTEPDIIPDEDDVYQGGDVEWEREYHGR